jgi:glucose/arabinose dehydrogenase
MKTYMRALAAAALLTAASARTTPAQDPAQTQPAPAQQQTTQPQQQTTPPQQQTTPPAPQTTPTPQADAAKPPTAAGKAVVFVYRPGKLVGGALEPSVYCDGVEVARMDNGRYFVLLLDPGEHRIRTTQEYKRVDLKLGAGEVAFVRVRIETGMMKGRGNVYLADEADAAKELKKLKPLGADKVKSTTLVADAAEAENQLRLRVK